MSKIDLWGNKIERFLYRKTYFYKFAGEKAITA